MLNHYSNEEEAIKNKESRLTQYLRDRINKPSEVHCPCMTVHRLVEESCKKIEKISK